MRRIPGTERAIVLVYSALLTADEESWTKDGVSKFIKGSIPSVLIYSGRLATGLHTSRVSGILREEDPVA